MPKWMILSLATIFFWGLWGFFPKLTTHHIDSRSAIIYEAIGWCIATAVMLAMTQISPAISFKGSLYGIATGICGFAGGYCFLKAVSEKEVSLIVSLTALYPVVTVILAILILHESLSVRQILGVFFSLVAIILIAE